MLADFILFEIFLIFNLIFYELWKALTIIFVLNQLLLLQPAYPLKKSTKKLLVKVF